jgi:hypothetical protein
MPEAQKFKQLGIPAPPEVMAGDLGPEDIKFKQAGGPIGAASKKAAQRTAGMPPEQLRAIMEAIMGGGQ